MLIVGVYLFFSAIRSRHLISFISGFAVIGLLLGSLLFDDEGILAFSLGILTLMPLGLGLKLIQKVLGVAFAILGDIGGAGSRRRGCSDLSLFQISEKDPLGICCGQTRDCQRRGVVFVFIRICGMIR